MCRAQLNDVVKSIDNGIVKSIDNGIVKGIA